MTDKVQLNDAQRRQLNQTAYKVLKEDIRRNYPHGRFVAIYEGRIVGDAADLDELEGVLEAQGIPPRETLAVEAGVDYPEYGIILSPFPLP